ncbi:hypothetical protein AVEN_50626-1 [Araneus ventricosus]|uniref:Uncharacterized protein n=1 Tax=Araneus ventricosus TaxID=182803 RepID=A0A4Y2AQL9_ARAVE|nr:hypothetical protein AVEN_50626-1 [Araneus ventricosus]
MLPLVFMYNSTILYNIWSRKWGLVAEFWLRDRRVAGSLPDPTEDPSCITVLLDFKTIQGQTSSCYCGSLKREVKARVSSLSSDDSSK